MISLTGIYRWLHIIVATLVVWSQGLIRQFFERHTLGGLATFATIVIALICLGLADKLIFRAIDRWRWLRGLLAGRSDIEGDWLDAVKDPANPTELASVEYSRIQFKNGQHVLSGESWAPDGTYRGSYETHGGNYTEGRFEFYYTTGYLELGGFGVLIFSSTVTDPRTFKCHYIDEENRTMFVAQGERVSKGFRELPRDQMRKAAME